MDEETLLIASENAVKQLILVARLDAFDDAVQGCRGSAAYNTVIFLSTARCRTWVVCKHNKK